MENGKRMEKEKNSIFLGIIIWRFMVGWHSASALHQPEKNERNKAKCIMI
jgi:hypothetical protein